MSKSVACSMLVVAACSSATPPPDENQLAVRATPAVVKVWAGWAGDLEVPELGLRAPIGPGWGSGFFISADGYLVTNAHVVADAQESELDWKRSVVSKVRAEVADLNVVRAMTPERRAATLDGIRIVHAQRIADIQLADGRHLPYHIAKADRPDIRTGKDIAILKVAIENAPTLELGDSSAVRLEDRLYAIGFPGAADFRRLEGRGPRHTDTSPLVASFTDGKVASVDQRASSGVPVLQVTIPITHGNSGGPVINQAGEVVGLATWGAADGRGASVAGFNFLVTINAVKDEVRAAGAVTSRSETDRLYRLALDAYFAGRYRDALETFEDVKELYSAVPGLARMMADARRQVRDGNPGGGGSSAGAVIAFLVVASVIGGLVVLARRAKGAASAAPLAPVAPPLAPLARTLAVSRDVLAHLTCGSLTCVQGPPAGRRFEVVASGLVIGRDPRAQIALADARISGWHARLDVQPGRVALVDGGSTNGTFVNGVRLGHGASRDLTDGDLVSLAEPAVATFMFRRGVPRTTLVGSPGGPQCN